MVAIYARQSIDKKDSVSIEAQISMCEKQLEDGEKTVIFQDKGYSGKNTKRPAFALLLNEIKRGNISKVVCYKFDRISRNLLDFVTIYDDFEHYKVAFASCKEQFDTSTPAGKFMLNILMCFAQMERETIVERCKDSYYSRAEKGMYPSGRAPLGYAITSTVKDGAKTKMLVENMSESHIIKDMYIYYVDNNKTLNEIAIKLNKLLNTTTFEGSRIKKMLKNPVYVRADKQVFEYLKTRFDITSPIEKFDGIHGCLLYGKCRYIQFTLHEGIISADRWLKAQLRLENNSKIKNHGTSYKTWLSGILRCGYCGYAASVTSGKNNIYVICGGKRRGVCDLKAFKITDIEEEIAIRLFDFMCKIEFNISDKIENPEISEINNAIIAINNKIENFITNMAFLNETTAKYINREVEKLDCEKSILENKITKIRYSNKRPEITENEVDEYIGGWTNFDVEAKKKIASIFIRKVTLTDAGVSVEFLF